MQNSNIIFSIIIPHHNIPLLLKRCLASIPERSDIQIIVVDDNSDPLIVDFKSFLEIDRNNVEVILTKEGLGAGYARNVGLKSAIGKWVIFADADDFFSNNLSDILDNYKDKEEDLIYFNIDSVYSDDISRKANRSEHKARLFSIPTDKTSVRELFFRYNYPEPWGKIIKRQLLIENNIFFDQTFICNDLFFSTKVGHYAKDIIVVDKVFYVVTLRENSLSNNTMYDFKKLTGRINATIPVYLFLKDNKISYKINPLRGLMVMLLKQHTSKFLNIMYNLKRRDVKILPLIFEIFDYRLFTK